jgi:small subunit ribosomal protein S11e
MTDIQTEKAFQKQIGVHLNSKRILSKKQTNIPRYHRAIGLGFKTPQAAIEGQYVDHKCPFTSKVTIRGRFFKGVVLSNKMTRTIILRRDYLHFIKKYNRFEKRHHNLPAHLSPAFPRVKIGDVVTVGQCRPISKTVRFNTVRIEKKKIEGNVRKTFCMF